MQWNIGLSDGLTGSARGIASALKGITASFKEVDAAALKTQAAMQKGIGAGAVGATSGAGGGLLGAIKGLSTNGLGSTIEELKNKWAEFAATDVGAVFSAGAGVAVSAISAIATAVAAVSIALAAMGAAATVAFAKSAIQAGVFRENTLIGLEVLLKDKIAANRVYASAVEMAGKTPFETQDVVTLYQKLLAGGFKEGELKDVATAIGDLGASRGMDKGLMDRLIDAFAKMKAGGKLDGEMIQSLISGGVNVGNVYAEIGKAMGKTAAEVQKLQGQGKISADVAQAAILKVIQGTFGGTMDKMSASLQGLWSSLVSRPFELLNATFATKGGLNDWFETIKSAVKGLGDELGPGSSTGKKAIAFANKIGEAFNSITKIMLGFGSGFAKGLNESMPDAEKFKGTDIEAAAKAFGMLGESLGKVAGGMASVGAFISQHQQAWNALGYTVAGVGAALGIVFAGLVIGAGVGLMMLLAIPAAFVAVGAAIVGIGVAMYKLGEYARELGASIGNWLIGLAKGVDFSSLFSGIGTALSSAASTAFGMAMGIGAQITAGITAGLASLASSLQNALDSATAGLVPKMPGGDKGGGGGNGGNGGGGGGAPKEAAPPGKYNGEASVGPNQFAPSSEAVGGSSKSFSVVIQNLVLGAGASAETAKANLTEAFLEIALKLGYA